MSEKATKKRASLFELDGVPSFGQAFPLSLQHVVAMIVGCVTPAIIIAGVSGLSDSDSVILIQSALVIAGLSTFLQLFPIGKKGGFHLGSGLPVIMGVNFAYLPSMQAIAGDFGPTAINYMAGGTSSPNYGSWQNWLVAIFTLAVVTILNHFGKGILKLASILIGIIAGYLFSLPFGMVDLSSVGTAGMFQLPSVMHFGVKFEISSCVAIGILFAINSIQAIGDFSATTSGGMDRQPTDDELQGGIVGYGIMNLLGAMIGGLPTATFSQNVGIVTTTRVVNRFVLGGAGAMILIAGLVPKFSALLTTIPQCVLGGATVSVFASIAMTGMKLVMTAHMNYRNTSIVGLAAALGMGVSQASASLSAFPTWVTTIFGRSPVVIATLIAVIMNIVLPDPDKKNE